MTIKIDAQCKECHSKLSVVWIDSNDNNDNDYWKLTIEQCKNCCEDAYDDGVLIGAMHGAPRVEQPEEKRVYCPYTTESCPREENADGKEKT